MKRFLTVTAVLCIFIAIAVLLSCPGFGQVADTTAPVISAISVSPVTSTSASIYWQTNEPADSVIEYGLTPLYESRTTDAALVTERRFLLSDLTPSTTYHYRLHSRDAAGNWAVTGD